MCCPFKHVASGMGVNLVGKISCGPEGGNHQLKAGVCAAGPLMQPVSRL